MILSSVSQINYQPTRIISLVPSQTELLHYLGLDEEIIAITKFCIHPNQWFNTKLRIGGTKTVDIEKIRSLKPDLIIANKEENIKEQVELLADEFTVWLTDVNNLKDACNMIRDIGTITHKENTASQLLDSIRYAFEQYKLFSLPSNPLQVAYLIWKDPYMTVGGDTFINDMLLQAGLKNVFNDRARYPEIEMSDLAKKDCDIILLSSEPYPFNQKHVKELELSLPAKKIILVDGEMFSWYGSRLLFVPGYFIDIINQYGLAEIKKTSQVISIKPDIV